MRFALLIVLVVVSTLTMLADHPFIRPFLGDPGNDLTGCNLAAGMDPQHSTWETVSGLVGRNSEALARCSAPFLTPWWVHVAICLALLLVAGIACLVVPAARIRRRRLTAIDPGSIDGRHLASIAERVGVRTTFVLDAGSRSANAVAFGRPGRTYVSVPTGLLVARDEQPQMFAAVVLHELAHVHNRDVGATYATIVVWRVFAVLILLPYLGMQLAFLVEAWVTPDEHWSTALLAPSGPEFLRETTTSLFIALLVYLSQADLLRTRELYADHRAVAWGAEPAVWSALALSHSRRSNARRLLSLAVHPSWSTRERALDEPGLILGRSGLTAFLTGAAASTIAHRAQFLPGDLATLPIGPALAGVLIAGTTCLTLWRGAVQSTIAGTPRDPGVRTGLWLGAGLVLSSVLSGDPLSAGSWLAVTPWLTLLLGGLALLCTCWTAQTASVLVRSFSVRRARIGALLGLAGIAGLLTLALEWWLTVRFLVGPELLDLIGTLAGQQFGGSSPALTLLVTALLLTTSATPMSGLTVWFAAPLWLIPLLAWLGHRPGTFPGYAPLPPLRTLVRSGLLAAAASVGLTVVSAVLLTGVIGLGTPERLLLFVGAVAGLTFLPSIWVAARYGGSRRTADGMVLGSIVSALAVIATCAGLAVIALTLGCALPAVAGGSGSCGGFVTDTVPLLGVVMAIYLGPGVIALTLVALVAFLIRGAGRRTPAATAAPGTAADGRGVRSGRASLAVIAAVALLGNLVTTASPLGGGGGSASLVDLGFVPEQTASSPRLREAQAVAWLRYGGDGLWTGFGDRLARLDAARDLLAEGDGTGPQAVRDGCAALAQWAAEAGRYFTVPDPEQNTTWERARMDTGSGGTACVTAIDSGDGPGLTAALDTITRARDDAAGVHRWFAEAVG